MVAGGSWAAVAIDPAAIVAGNEAGAATLHFADRGTGTHDAARVSGLMFVSRCGRRGGKGDESEKTDEDGAHCV